MLKKWLIVPLFFVISITGVQANETVPKPQGLVNDFAGVISEGYKQKLSSIILELEEKTSAEIAVVTIGSIAPYDEKEYARLLFDSWKPGKKGKDNGVLVLLAIQERRWRIETGYGVEGVLPDGLCGEIGRNYMVPYFKNGDYQQGLYNGVMEIAKTIARSQNVVLESLQGVTIEAPQRKSGNDPFIYLFAFFFFLFWNLFWPVYVGLPFSLLFAAAFLNVSKLASALVLAGYGCSMIIRYFHWVNLPADKRKSFFGPQVYGTGTYSNYGGGGFGGGGFGGGGFGGGGGGGGGAGGGF
ncbi:MAG: TPM domain-containing protein [Candidatus Omnitrophica bacterium]|nr:TPM domain-containing protein [Candidatus Omnitrophota bacterium]